MYPYCISFSINILAHAWIQKKETVCWDPHLKHHKAIGFISITEITKAIKQSMLGHHRLPAKHFAGKR